MGYSKLTYDDYYNALDYWQGDLGIVLPQWADEISAYGRSVSAIDFYGIFSAMIWKIMQNPMNTRRANMER